MSGQRGQRTNPGGWLIAAALCLTACSQPAPPPDGAPCAVTVFTQEIAVARPQHVDLLLVVDNSASMSGQQRSLRDDVSRALRATPFDLYDALSLHVSVVTSDMGVGGPGSLSEGCTEPLGGDGRMLRQHTGGDPACAATALDEPFVSYETGDDLDAVIDRVACLANTGSAGCGFEQPLEAALKALTSSTSPLRFQRERGGVIESDTGGHGDGANAGFLRDDSYLIIVVLSDEDDCSTSDMDLYTPSGAAPQYPAAVAGPSADPSAQCATYRGALHPVQRYIDGFQDIRPNTRYTVAFVAVSGVSPDALDRHATVWSQNGVAAHEIDFTGLLGDPEMAEQLASGGGAVTPVCTRPDPADPESASAAFPVYPSRRLLAVAQGLFAAGGGGYASSLCSPVSPSSGDYALDLWDLSGALVPFVSSDGPDGTRLPRPFPRDESGRVACRFTETLPVGARCQDVAGRTLARTDDGREVCDVAQVVVPPDLQLPGALITGAGWFYDDFNPWLYFSGDQGLRYVPGSEPLPGSRYKVQCLTPGTVAGVDASASLSCVVNGE